VGNVSVSEPKKCLLICPSFFSYDSEIKNAIERNGYTVRLYDERPFRGVVGKSLVRLGLSILTNSAIKKYYKEIYDSTDEHYDLLFIINPECITPDIVSYFKKKCEKVIVYMWDSFENKINSVKLIPCADVFFTFDPHDAHNYNIKFKPLFYVPDYICDPIDGSESYEVSFVGTAHSSRFKLVNDIAQGHSCFTFFYCPGKIVFFMKKFFFKELSGMKQNDVSFVPLNRKDVINILKSSKAIIDIAHPKQQGLTMRTIESIACQRKLITTNKNAQNYDFFSKSNVLIVDTDINNQVISEFLNLDHVALPAEIYTKYFIDNWVRDIIEEVPEHG